MLVLVIPGKLSKLTNLEGKSYDMDATRRKRKILNFRNRNRYQKNSSNIFD